MTIGSRFGIEIDQEIEVCRLERVGEPMEIWVSPGLGYEPPPRWVEIEVETGPSAGKRMTVGERQLELLRRPLSIDLWFFSLAIQFHQKERHAYRAS